MVPLVTSQRAPVRTCFLTNRAAGNPVLLEISLKGTFFLQAEPFFFFFLNRWSRDISVFSRLGSTSTRFFCFLRAFRSLSRIEHPFVAALTQPSHSLQSAAVSSALSPPTISEWTTRTCATRGWCLAGRSWQKSSSGVQSVRSYTLNTAGMPADLFAWWAWGRCRKSEQRQRRDF